MSKRCGEREAGLRSGGEGKGMLKSKQKSQQSDKNQHPSIPCAYEFRFALMTALQTISNQIPHVWCLRCTRFFCWIRFWLSFRDFSFSICLTSSEVGGFCHVIHINGKFLHFFINSSAIPCAVLRIYFDLSSLFLSVANRSNSKAQINKHV